MASRKKFIQSARAVLDKIRQSAQLRLTSLGGAKPKHRHQRSCVRESICWEREREMFFIASCELVTATVLTGQFAKAAVMLDTLKLTVFNPEDLPKLDALQKQLLEEASK